MAEPSVLHSFLAARFLESFGEPAHSLGKDQHWSLRPAPGAIPIDVLVNGAVDWPSVWIFDTYNSRDGVVQIRVTTEDEVLAIVTQINERLEKAANGQTRR